MALLDERRSEGEQRQNEALFREARQRRRRRWLLTGTVVLLVATLIGGFLLSLPGPPSSVPPVAAQPGRPLGPVVERAAFAHHGRLAFVSRGTLWVLDGSTASLRAVATPGLVATDPTFSPDGTWLAFIASQEAVEHDFHETLSSTLWLARANGSEAHSVHGVAADASFGWSPRGDVLAVAVGGVADGPYAATGLDLVNPSGSIRELIAKTNVISAVWSPDGSAIAVSTEGGAEPSTLTATLADYPVRGGSPTVWESHGAGFIVPAGWWPVWGIGYTTVGAGAVPGGSATADGSPLYAIARPGAIPVLLGATLQNESTGAPSVSATGWLAFVETGGSDAGRIIWQGKQVVVCSPVTAQCVPVPHPSGTVTVDPVWSPNGSTLAYAQGSALADAGFPQQIVSAWYHSHQLLLYEPATGSTQVNTHAPGATVPRWSSDGRSVLYVSDNALWLDPTPSSPSVPIAEPLFTPGQWPAFYGQVPFSSQFAWSSRP